MAAGQLDGRRSNARRRAVESGVSKMRDCRTLLAVLGSLVHAFVDRYEGVYFEQRRDAGAAPDV